MTKTTISELVDLLSKPTLRVRTGIWLYPMNLLGEEENEAVRLNVVARDARIPLLATIEPGSRFLGLDRARLLRLLDEIVQNEQDSSVIMIFNFDLLLAKLPMDEREKAWRAIFRDFPHRSKGFFLLIPEKATELLPSDDFLEDWRLAGRLAETL